MPRSTTVRASPAFETTPEVRPPAYVQGIYWVLSGLWPLFHRQSFEWVTGPKMDYWLVELVGLLLATIGATMIAARAREKITGEIGGLVIAATLAVIGISVSYASIERISPVYLAEAGIEVLFLIGWIRWAVWRPRHRVVTTPVAVEDDVPDSPKSLSG